MISWLQGNVFSSSMENVQLQVVKMMVKMMIMMLR